MDRLFRKRKLRVLEVLFNYWLIIINGVLQIVIVVRRK